MRRVLGCIYYTVRNYRKLQLYPYSMHLQFAVTHALGFSVFTSRILATDLSLTVTSNNMWSSCHSLIPFVPFLQLPSLKTRLFYSRIKLHTPFYSAFLLLSCRTLLIITFARTPRKTPSSIIKNAYLLGLYLAMDVLLLSAFVAGMCLLTRCLAMDIHVTILSKCFLCYFSCRTRTLCWMM
jgi:hypothetical protein